MVLDERMQLAREILIDLYLKGYVQTIYNTTSKKNQEEGYFLKSGIWSPWYLNLRPLGATPELVTRIAYGMNRMIRGNVPGLTQIVGVEMAGVPLVSVISTAQDCENIPYSFTRPLPGPKVRTPDEAAAVLQNLSDIHGYGSKNLLEGVLQEGDVICITDDMVTNFGSKLIAKLIIKYEAKRKNLEDVCVEHVAVILDREQGAEQEALKNGMQLHSLIKFKSEGLGWLQETMFPEEYDLICDYQNDPLAFQDLSLQRETLNKASGFKYN